MSSVIQKEYLNDQELFFYRTKSQHIRRVEEIRKGKSPLANTSEGVLVVHLFPDECQLGRSIFSGAQLKAAGAKVPPLGRSTPGTSKFNVDGLLNYASWNEISTYSQIFRDGHVEGVMTGIACPSLSFSQRTNVLKSCVVGAILFGKLVAWKRPPTSMKTANIVLYSAKDS